MLKKGKLKKLIMSKMVPFVLVLAMVFSNAGITALANENDEPEVEFEEVFDNENDILDDCDEAADTDFESNNEITGDTAGQDGEEVFDIWDEESSEVEEIVGEFTSDNDMEVPLIDELSEEDISIESSSSGYDRNAALNYAETNWNRNSDQLCAEYVSNCLAAGGRTEWSRSASDLFSKLQKSGAGTMVELPFNGKVDGSAYGQRLVGCPVWFWCSKCSDGKPYIHVVLCRTLGSNGKLYCYSHNNANSGRSEYSYNTTCYACEGAVTKAYAYIFDGGVPNSIDFGKSSLELVAGETTVINFNFSGDGIYKLSFNNNDSFSGEWGDVDWDTGKASLTFTAKIVGTMNLEVNLLNSSEEVFYTGRLSVKIKPPTNKPISCRESAVNINVGETKELVAYVQSPPWWAYTNVGYSTSTDICEVNFLSPARYENDNKRIRLEFELTGLRRGIHDFYIQVCDSNGNLVQKLEIDINVKQPVTQISLTGSTKMAVGESKTITATVSPLDASNKTLNWTSSNTSVLTVNASTGYVTAKSAGTATITAKATDGSGISQSLTITIVQPVTKISLTGPSKMNVGESKTITATVSPSDASNKTLNWSSSNTSVATVNSSTGYVTAKSAGTATITANATDGSGISQSLTITVVQPVTKISLTGPSKMTVGETKTITATVSPSDATNKTLSWSSSNTSVLAVNSGTGQVTAKSSGTATITAKATDGSGISGSLTITVVNAVTPSPSPIPSIKPVTEIILWGETSITVGDTTSLGALIFPGDATNTKLTWTSSNTDILTVTSDGTVTAKSVGRATITAMATDGSWTNGNLTITVSDKDVPSPSVEPITPSPSPSVQPTTPSAAPSLQPTTPTPKPSIAPEDNDIRFKYIIRNGEAYIQSFLGTGSVLEFPETIDGYTVRGIGGPTERYWFDYDGKDDSYNEYTIKKIIIPKTVTYVVKQFMINLKGVEELVIEDGASFSLTDENGDRIFDPINENPLKKIYIGSGMTGDLESMCCGRALETIEVSKDNPEYASKDGILYSKDMTKLYICGTAYKADTVTIPSTVTEIGTGFEGCLNIGKIIVPSSVKTISDNAFKNCSAKVSHKQSDSSENESPAINPGIDFGIKPVAPIAEVKPHDPPYVVVKQKISVVGYFNLTNKVVGYKVESLGGKATVNSKGFMTGKAAGKVKVMPYIKVDGRKILDTTHSQIFEILPVYFAADKLTITHAGGYVLTRDLIPGMVGKQKVTWTAKSNAAATLYDLGGEPAYATNDGYIMANKTGTIKITAIIENERGGTAKYVKTIRVKVPKLNLKDGTRIAIGKSKSLQVLNVAGGSNITWSCSDENICKIVRDPSKQGKVSLVALKPGAAKITANIDGHAYSTNIVVK